LYGTVKVGEINLMASKISSFTFISLTARLKTIPMELLELTPSNQSN
jgi:hypothetical protein